MKIQNMIRWITAILGYIFFRFPGAIIGYLIGSLLENSGVSFGTNKRHSKARPAFTKQRNVTPSDFELNLLALASLVIKADGIVNNKELDYVRGYFRNAYGEQRASEIFSIFNQVKKKRQISAAHIGRAMRNNMRYESRLQMIHFLFGIAKADGFVTQNEVLVIQEIARHLGIQSRDFESIKAMFFDNPDSAYKILEIEKTASISEIKSAYRTMVKKYHPDKILHQDEAYKRGAVEKFRKVQEAYEKLQKERGF